MSVRRKPYEASALAGTAAMFFFNLPANYATSSSSWCLRCSSARPRRPVARGAHARVRRVTAFNASGCDLHLVADDERRVVYDYYICAALLGFFVAWIATWIVTPSEKARYPLVTACPTDPPHPSSTESAAS